MDDISGQGRDQERPVEEPYGGHEESSGRSKGEPSAMSGPSVPEPSQGTEPNNSDSNDDKGLVATLKKVPKPVYVGIALVVVIFVALLSTHVICSHEWAEATCTEPETCNICGRTQGEPLGHEWEKATCTRPKTCQRCNETEGAPLGHTWTEATCTKPETCIVCGSITGDPLGHDVAEWTVDKEATCTETGLRHGTCVRCGEMAREDIPLAPHTEGEWTITKDALVSKDLTGERVLHCAVCGAEMKTETYTATPEEVAAAFKAECAWPSFDEVARNPDEWEGSQVAFKGEVIQVLQEGNSYTLRVNVTQQRYYWDDTIMVSYKAEPGDARILEDDVLTFYGTMGGMYSYQSVLGATITVPLMHAEYVE